MQIIEAVYENGVFRPLGPVNLSESQTVVLSVQDDVLEQLIDRDFLAQHAGASTPPGTLEKVRAILSKIPETTTELIRQERDEH
jgi:predicted DNA-binding antitoxin AbrB/MazE fold protein